MANGMLIAAVSSAVLLGLFGLSCYLMTIVNPPPLVIAEDPLPAGDGVKEGDKGGEGGGGTGRRYEVNVTPKTTGTTPKSKVNKNSNSKGRRSIRIPTKFHESKSIILEVSGDEGSPRIEIVFYPKHSMKQKKTRKVRKDMPYDDGKGKSRESVLVKISSDGKVIFEEHGVVIPAEVAEDMISEKTIVHDLDTLRPDNEMVGTNTLLPIFIENESVDLNTKALIPNNSVVDYIYTHAVITENIAPDEVSIREENASVNTYTQSPGITVIRETLANKNQMDYIHTSATLVKNTLDNETSTTLENTAIDEVTIAPISEESVVNDLDNKTLFSTEMDDVLVSERSSLDNLTTGSNAEITVSDIIDSEVPISTENGAEDAVTVASTFEKRAADDLDTKTISEEMVVSDTNEPIFADTTPNDFNNIEISRENGTYTPHTKTLPSEEKEVSDTNERFFAETTLNYLNNVAISRDNGGEDADTIAPTFEKRAVDNLDTKTLPSEEMVVSDTNEPIIAETTPNDLNDDAISRENGGEDAEINNAADQSGEIQQELPSTVESVEGGTDAVTDANVREAADGAETTESMTALSQPVEVIADEVSEETDSDVVSDTANKVTVDSIEAGAESNQNGIVVSNGIFKD